jgi:hypothetical protein
MQKVYLLLRSNQQTGPHSLEELLQLRLQPFDLVWVEGKSYGWSYPSEIDSLKPFIKSHESSVQTSLQDSTEPALHVTTPAPPVPLSSSPDYSIEQKAEELRRRAQAYVPQNHLPHEEVKTNYSRNLNEVEEEYTSWMYQKKTGKTHFNKKTWIITAFIFTSVAGIWWALRTKPGATANPAPQVSVQKLAREKPKDESIEPPDLSGSSAGSQPKSASNLPAKHGIKKAIEKKQQTGIVTIKEKVAVPEPVIAQKQTVNGPEENTTAPATEENKEPAVVQKPKEKRTLGTLFGGLFKKNKKDEATQGEPKPADNSNNERNATRRNEAETATAGTIDLTEGIDIKMNKSSDDWMMGIQGLRLTLYNHSTTALKTAEVDVLYYSDQNSLLQKKRISFSNVAPGKSQTIPAPDHRTADHADYKIISATGIANAYARQ